MIVHFLNTPEEPLLILMTSSGGQLTPMTHFSSQIKSKASYFIRKKDEAVTLENFRDVLIFGDMAGKPVEELAVLVEEVFLPLLSNEGNQKGWPQVVADDVISHVQAFNNIVYQVGPKAVLPIVYIYVTNVILCIKVHFKYHRKEFELVQQYVSNYSNKLK